MTDFTPTHRTNRAIGKIKAGSLIRVAQYNDIGFFSEVLGQLGVKSDHIEYRYYGNEVQFWVSSYRGDTTKYALPDEYVITDGEHFEVSDTDSGWDSLGAREVSGTEEVAITFHETYYCLHGKETGTVLRMTAKEILSLAERIEDFVPEPSPIESARFIRARTRVLGEFRTLAKFDDAWYDDNGNEHTEKQVLDNYDEIGVIR